VRPEALQALELRSRLRVTLPFQSSTDSSLECQFDGIATNVDRPIVSLSRQENSRVFFRKERAIFRTSTIEIIGYP